MFLKFYNLNEQPFGTTPNPRYLYASAAHREALASLVYGINSNLGFGTLVAEPGMGKTSLVFWILKYLKHSARTAFLFETQCNSQSLLRYLLRELGVQHPYTDPVVLHEKFKEVLRDEARIGRRVVVMIDEAQNLDVEVLETVRLLSDFETPEAKLVHIILIGQPNLGEKLRRPELDQLRQRIPIVSFLKPLALGDVTRYVNHRLTIAGYRGPQLFTHSALEAIAELSGGVPRKINALCFNAMSLGAALKRKEIGSSLIDEAGADLDLKRIMRDLDSRHSASTEEAVTVPDTVQNAGNGKGTHVPQVEGAHYTTANFTQATHAENNQTVSRTRNIERKCPVISSATLPYSSNPASDEAVRDALAYLQSFLARNKRNAVTQDSPSPLY